MGHDQKTERVVQRPVGVPPIEIPAPAIDAVGVPVGVLHRRDAREREPERVDQRRRRRQVLDGEALAQIRLIGSEAHDRRDARTGLQPRARAAVGAEALGVGHAVGVVCDGEVVAVAAEALAQ